MFTIFFLEIIVFFRNNNNNIKNNVMDINDIFGIYSHFVLVPFVSYSVCENHASQNKIIL